MQAYPFSVSLLQRSREEARDEVSSGSNAGRTYRRLWGPASSIRHDSYLLAQSGLMQKVATLNSPSGHPYCLHGDPAYGLSNHLVCPFSVASVGPLTPEMADVNKHMSHCRVTVEWGFKEVTSMWAFVNMKPQQKFLLSPVAKLYRVATLLSNWH